MDKAMNWVYQFWPCFFLVGLSWLTYWDSLKNQWVSDDIDPGGGIAIHDGLMHVKGWPFKNRCSGCQEGKCPKTAPLGYGILFKQFRWYLGKVPNSGYNKSLNPTDPNAPKDMRYWIAHSVRHHRFNIIIFSGVVISLYCFLSYLIGEKLAFLTMCLFVVHPSGVLPVGWISGIGYPMGLFWASIGLNLSVLWQMHGWSSSLQTLLGVILYGLFQYLAVNAMFATWGVVFILILLKLWPFVIVAGIIGVWNCFRTFREAVTFRVKTFTEQQMGYSTKFHFRKLFVVPKTVAYYTKLSFFPKRLGLYHKYGYHYEMPHIELEDKYFWIGILLLILFTIGLIFGPFPIKLALTIYLSFLVLFMNWIVVHQFVSERYIWMPSLGTCLFFAYMSQNYVPLFWVVFGIAIMRTWVHIPSYKDEINFYQSNIFNFPDSEVAYGNLGVVYLRQGMTGSAIDNWFKGTFINPEYDVNWYNLYSIFKGQGQLVQAKGFLERAIRSKTCHFPKNWENELIQINTEINSQNKFNELSQYLLEIKKDPSKQDDAKNLEQALLNVQNMRKIMDDEKKKHEQELVSKLQELNQQKVGIEFQMKQGEEQKKMLDGINIEQNAIIQRNVAIENLYNAMQVKKNAESSALPNNPSQVS